MDKTQQEKVARYLKNASRFLWGLGPGNQKKTYAWLRERGFDFYNGTYSHVTNQLLDNYGIEQILKRIVIPRVTELFSVKVINFLRESWLAGTKPDISFVRLYNIPNPSGFLEVNTQFNFVEGWGDLAGVWFEEIEKIEELREAIKRV